MYNILKLTTSKGTTQQTLKHDNAALAKKSGYVFPLILFATLAVGLFIVTITQFQSSNRLKYQHLNNYQSAFNIAYSALVEVLADIQSRQWSNRSFKTGPKDKSADLFGGRYDLRVENHDTLEYVFNTKVRVAYKNKKHLFYWRLKYNPNLLDFTSLFVPIFFEDFQNSATIPANPDELDELVDKKLEQREENRPKVIEIAETLKPTPTIKEALKKVGINADNVNHAEQVRPAGTVIDLPLADLALKDLAQLVADIDSEATYVIKDLHFEGDIAALNAEQMLLLDTLAELLQSKPDCKIELRGHTTGVVGTAEGNMTFSIARAQNVADYLQNAGIEADRITVKGFGQTQPIASNDTLEGQAKNRRVEFVLSEDPS
ncbi:MAG: OmpA family protein [Candidatus Riflebacteria bacterium]|nr:OmpA family protein [Candidatus Riflebacteria bacterium]